MLRCGGGGARVKERGILFWPKVDKAGPVVNGMASPCWLWRAATNAKGYGRCSHSGRMRLAHGVSFELSGSVVPEGYTIDHLCRVRHCVNPDHLEAVPHRVNLLRGNTVTAACAAKTHCVNGHPFDVINTSRANNGARRCRACARVRNYQTYQPRTNARRRRPKLTDEERAGIRSMIGEGMTQEAVAMRFNVGQSTVSRVLNGEK